MVSFSIGDLSALSNKKVILTWDPAENDVNFQRYLEFVKEGGTIIVINTDGKFVGGFSKLLSLKGGNETKFDSISQIGARQLSQTLAISGSARSILDLESVNASVKSFYMNNNRKVSAFAIDKTYGDAGGRIIFVNSGGYFDAIFKSPQRYFMTLTHIPTQINLDLGKYTNEILPKAEFPVHDLSET